MTIIVAKKISLGWGLIQVIELLLSTTPVSPKPNTTG
jgi:hypothetical protein